MISTVKQTPSSIERVAPNRYRYNYNVRAVERMEECDNGQMVAADLNHKEWRSR